MKEARDLFKRIDLYKNGVVNYSEWLIVARDKQKLVQEEWMQAAFQKFDFDGSGKISALNIKSILGANQESENEDIWEEIIKEVDKDGDGLLSYDDFKIMMEKTL
jgi:calcium-dependent protein kinase